MEMCVDYLRKFINDFFKGLYIYLRILEMNSFEIVAVFEKKQDAFNGDTCTLDNRCAA